MYLSLIRVPQVYDVDIVPLLVSTLRDLFENYGLKEFLMSATLRNQDTFNTFLNACGRFLPYALPSRSYS
jgi:hypothetical protein